VQRVLVALLAAVAATSAVAGALVGANEDDQGRQRQAQPAPEADRRGRAGGPAARVPLEREVAQLFLFGFRGTQVNADLLRRLNLGGIVLERPNFTDAAQLDALGADAVAIAKRARHIAPWVLAVQDGGELNSLRGLPPALAPADLPSARAAARLATETARTLRGLHVSGVLDPDVDVGAAESALGARIYSDEPAEVSAYADAVVHAYRRGRLFSAAKHFPGLGAADQSTALGPASVGLDLAQLRERDLIPFRAAIEAGVPAVVLSHALYPMNDFTRPASLSREVATDLLRDELHFAGVAITDDLADPAISTEYSVPDAAVQALKAGADMLVVSGTTADQEAAFAGVVRAVRRGDVAHQRIDQAFERVLAAKRDYGLIR